MHIQITAKTDAPTLCSFAHHSYFNLTGQSDTTGHTLQVDADYYLPVDEGLIPLGEVADVTDTAFDFRTPRALTSTLEVDHNLCLSTQRRVLQKVATLAAPSQGISMDIATTETGLQVYTGQGIAEGGAVGNNGEVYDAYGGIAMEPQIWPDAPNHAAFPSAVLLPDETYQQVSQFSFQS